jgi:hypothetical protein
MRHALLVTLILLSDTLCLRRSHRHERDSRIRPAKAASKAPVREAPAASCSLALVCRVVRTAHAGMAVVGSLTMGRRGLHGGRTRRGATDCPLRRERVFGGTLSPRRRPFRYSGQPDPPRRSRLFPVPGAQALVAMRSFRARSADNPVAIGLSGSTQRPTRVAIRGPNRGASPGPRPPPLHRLKQFKPAA